MDILALLYREIKVIYESEAIDESLLQHSSCGPRAHQHGLVLEIVLPLGGRYSNHQQPYQGRDTGFDGVYYVSSRAEGPQWSFPRCSAFGTENRTHFEIRSRNLNSTGLRPASKRLCLGRYSDACSGDDMSTALDDLDHGKFGRA